MENKDLVSIVKRTLFRAGVISFSTLIFTSCVNIQTGKMAKIAKYADYNKDGSISNEEINKFEYEVMAHNNVKKMPYTVVSQELGLAYLCNENGDQVSVDKFNEMIANYTRPSDEVKKKRKVIVEETE